MTGPNPPTAQAIADSATLVVSPRSKDLAVNMTATGLLRVVWHIDAPTKKAPSVDNWGLFLLSFEMAHEDSKRDECVSVLFINLLFLRAPSQGRNYRRCDRLESPVF